jgi:predicted amidohydrolase
MTRVAAVIVGTTEARFRHHDANSERLELAAQIAGFTNGAADVVLLPAGFLAVKTMTEVLPSAKSLAAIFRQQALLAGIDEEDDETGGTKGQRAGKTGDAGNCDGYHYWAFASDAGSVLGEPWWQRSAFSGEVVSDPSPRCVSVRNIKIGLLICGELYNPALADSLADAGPDLVVDLAHISMKRFTKSLHRVAKTTGRPVFHAQHVAINSRGAAKWMAKSRGPRCDRGVNWASYEKSSRLADLWAEVKVWEA